MKKSIQIVLLFVGFMFCFTSNVDAANEVEPNNSFATANYFAQNTVMNGTLVNGNEDFLVGATTVSGALKIIFTLNNTSVPNTPDLTLYVYNKNQGTINSYSYNNRPLGSFTDSITIFSRQADTIYFRLVANNGFSYNIRYGTITNGFSDVEPNNTFETAKLISANAPVNGHVGYWSVTQDDYDYFKSYMPSDGQINVIANYTNTSGDLGADFYMNVYSYQRGLIGSISHNNTGLGSFTDTIKIPCRVRDSIYIRTNIYNGAFAYNFTYQVAATTNNDIEPNNTFATAQVIQANTTVLGHVGYTKLAQDDYDYFKSWMPTDGKIKLKVNFTNTSFDVGADFYIDIYSKQKGVIGSINRANVGSGSFSDSTEISCRVQDSIYIRTTIYNGCFSYDFKYQVVPTTNNDTEPNNDFATAQIIQPNTTVLGHVGYTGTSQDSYDYFKSLLPSDGTIKLKVNFTNTSFDAGADFYLDIYSKQKGVIGSINRANVGSGSFSDSIQIACRAQDTIYIRTNIYNGCFSYDFKYDVIPTTKNDVEPNNDFATAQIIQPNTTVLGHVGYFAGAQDDYDFYKAYLPADGTIRLDLNFINSSFDVGADFYLNIYSKQKGVIGSISRANVGIGSFVDSLEIACRTQDSIYIRTNVYNGCFSYDFVLTVDSTSSNDIEPNNSFATAQLIQANTVVGGHVGATGTAQDDYDYFVTYLPSDGTIKLKLDFENTSFDSGADFDLNIYSSQKGTIGTISRPNVGLGSFSDSAFVYCRAQDTIYIRTNIYNGCFTYTFKYEVIPTTYSDAEPNNTIALAQLVPANVPITGSIGHAGITTDTHDYYKIPNTGLSNVTFLLEVNNTSNSAGSDFYFYVKKKAGGNLYSKSYANRPKGTFYDTLSYNCATADTLFIHTTSNGCFEYKITPIIKDALPKSDIVVARVANAVAFEANTTNADIINWNFDDGTTSTLRFPKKDFNIGSYYVTLSAKNSQCNKTDIDTFFVEVAGIETYAPHFAGAGGDATMIVYGGGLDTNANVYLRKNGKEYANIQKYGSAKRDQLQVLFDLHFADAGFFDVVVEIPNEAPIVFTNGFEIRDFEYPFTASQIIGPNRFRINRDNRFVLSVNNSGNVKANGVVVTMIWPKTTKVTFDTEWFRPPSTGTYRITVEDTDFDWEYADIQAFYDSAYSAPTPITSYAGQPYDGYMKMIQIAAIAAGGTYEIPFMANAPAAGLQNFITYTSKPNLFGSCGNATYADMSENLAVEAIDVIDKGLSMAQMDKTPVGWLAKAVKGTTKHMANLGQVMGATVNYLDGTTNSIYESLPADFNANVDAGNAQVASAVLEVATDKLVDAGAAKIMRGKTDDINRWMADNPNASLSSFEFAVDNLNDIQGVRDFVKNAYEAGKDLKTLNEKVTRLKELAKDCPELQKQLDDLIKEIDNEMKQREVNEKETRSVVSMDPNAIYGPVGIDTAQRFVNGFAQHNFLVTYENVDTATADAQVVRVRVPLDTNAFNLETFVFGNVSIAGKTYLVPKLRDNFMIDIDLKQSRGMMVRVMGYIDVKDQSANWTFISLDTVTNNLPLLDGFLPPNILAPNGEGSVSYQIDLKNNNADGTQTNSLAEIVFDENDAIYTENWQNIIDIVPSTSFVTTTLLGNNEIKMNLNGSDAQSGIDFYHVYVSEDGGTNWTQLFGVSQDTITLQGEPGKTYDFYVISRDRVGNTELKTPGSESTVIVPGGDSKFNPSLLVLPNPNTGTFRLRSNGYFYNGDLIVTNTMGAIVYRTTTTLAVGVDTEITLPILASGTYFLRFTSKEEGRATSNKLVIIRP